MMHHESPEGRQQTDPNTFVDESTPSDADHTSPPPRDPYIIITGSDGRSEHIINSVTGEVQVVYLEK